MDGDVEVIETKPDHEPYEGHHHQGGEQALGVEESAMVGVCLLGQSQVAGDGGVGAENIQVMAIHQLLQSDLDNVTGVGQNKKLEEWMETTMDVNI